MKLAIGKCGIASLVIAIVLTAGCAPMTEAQREAREYDRIEFRNRFLEDRARCNAIGGRIFILANSGLLDRDGVPKSRVYYTCT